MVKKRILSLIAASVLLCAACAEAGAEATIRMSDADFVLPSALTAIEDEAFMGVDASVIYLGDRVTSIGGRAFAECTSLEKIRIPASVTAIADTAFDGCPAGLKIYGADRSEAKRFASRKGFQFVPEEDSGEILLPEI